MPTTFGPFSFDPTAGALSRDGKPVSMGTRGAALLGALIGGDGAPVTKEALMEAGWPGTIVEEGNLSVQIAALRKAMGPRSDGQDWIATVPRVGYRLLKAPSPAATEMTAHVLPSLAVLPFANMSGDPEQEYFADGIVEDVITALSRFRSFAVIARNSSFVYKGRAVDVRQVARELAVRYVLEGSVRKAGDRLRISTQLVDGETGAHLWAQNYDGLLGDVFEFQDRITESVVGVVEPRVRRAEIERSRRERPDSLAAYDLYLQALPNVYAMRPEAASRAIELLDRAIAIDPNFALAQVLDGLAYLARHTMQLEGAEPERDIAQALGHVHAALATGTDDPTILGYAGFILCQLGLQYEQGFALMRRAVTENPNNVMVLTNFGIACLLAGDLDEADANLQRAIKLNPREFDAHWQLTGIAHIRMAQRRYDEALEVANRSLGINPAYDATFWMIIAANAYLGRMQEAREAIEGLRRISPHTSLARIRRGQRSRDPWRIDVLIEGMRLAGLAEE
jgi:adenylate cyclase